MKAGVLNEGIRRAQARIRVLMIFDFLFRPDCLLLPSKEGVRVLKRRALRWLVENVKDHKQRALS
jgi:hypothetical protein